MNKTKRTGLLTCNLELILGGGHVTLSEARHALGADDVYNLFCGATASEVHAAFERLEALWRCARDNRRYAYAKVLLALLEALVDYAPSGRWDFYHDRIALLVGDVVEPRKGV